MFIGSGQKRQFGKRTNAKGSLRALKISSNARYKTDFKPIDQLGSDSNTLFLLSPAAPMKTKDIKLTNAGFLDDLKREFR